MTTRELCRQILAERQPVQPQEPITPTPAKRKPYQKKARPVIPQERYQLPEISDKAHLRGQREERQRVLVLIETEMAWAEKEKNYERQQILLWLKRKLLP
ncbi:MAG: hypothetical protein K1Y36_06765 [Blastocatellia bacterium]|nr:hypothetical protein [Blastocatellia bacterium]